MRLLGVVVGFVAAAFALVATAADASGSGTFCVSDASCVTAGGTAEPDLQTALNAADAADGSETIDVGPGTFSAGSDSFTDSSGANAISIVGSGEGSTILTANNSSGSVLYMYPDENASVSDLTVDMGDSAEGLGYPNHVTDVAIEGGSDTAATGLGIQNGTVTNVTITMPLGGTTQGVYRPNGTVTINGLTITADTGFEIGGGSDDDYSNIRIFADVDGLAMAANDNGLSNTSTITDSEIVITGSQPGASALTLDNSGASSSDEGTLDASFLTLVGNSEPDSIGVQSYAANGASKGAIDLSNSIVEDFVTPLLCYDTNNGSTDMSSAAITASYSDFDSSADEGGCTGGITLGTGNITADPKLVTLADGDSPSPSTRRQLPRAIRR